MTGFRGHHGFLAGIVGGLMLDKEAFVILLIGVAIGAAGSFLISGAAAVARWVRDRIDAGGPYDHNGRPW